MTEKAQIPNHDVKTLEHVVAILTEAYQIPKLDVGTLKCVLDFVKIDYDSYDQLCKEFAESDEKKSEHFYFKKCAVESTISLINFLIKAQQEVE